MASTITLVSTVRSMRTYNLPHEACCVEDCMCSNNRYIAYSHDPRSGDVLPKEHVCKVPKAIILPALGSLPKLPIAVLLAPDVIAAKNAGELRAVVEN